MWAILELLVLSGIVLISLTEFFYPLVVGKPLFPSFRKQTETPPETTSLKDELSKAKAKVAEVKNVQDEVNKNFKSAEQLKEESDNLFNK
ncbi:MAG: hypothetical protein JSS79_02335 [Bacteroidetes bacterium]|nr:hypothetical protein [Bacteroidota bacterium]